MGVGPGGDRTVAPHPCLTPLCCLFVLVCFVFLHSLLSIKKPFLQPASDAHSLPLSINDVPPSLAHQKEPCAFSEPGVGVPGQGHLEDTGSGLWFVEQLETFFFLGRAAQLLDLNYRVKELNPGYGSEKVESLTTQPPILLRSS